MRHGSCGRVRGSLGVAWASGPEEAEYITREGPHGHCAVFTSGPMRGGYIAAASPLEPLVA